MLTIFDDRTITPRRKKIRMSSSPLMIRTIALVILLIPFSYSGSHAQQKSRAATRPGNIEERLRKLSELFTISEKNDDLEGLLKHYSENAICMAEYQPTLQGIKEISNFYEEILQRQNIKTLHRKRDEIIRLGKTFIEIGTFKKEYTDSKAGDSLLTQNGKYWHIWEEQSNGRLQLKGEAFGFFHPIKNPEALTVNLKKHQDEADLPLDKETPFELEAYSALMEKAVKNRDGIIRSAFFTNDARVMPFADSTRTGIDNIKPYLIAYNSGDVTIDSIKVYTYHSESFQDYILEYTKFRVKWRVPQSSGRTEGKGIRIWKRQADNSLKMYREIGTHNYIP